MATGKPLSADAFIENVTRQYDEMIMNAKKKIARLERVPLYKGPVRLNAKITMVHGNKKIADTVFWIW